MENLTTNEPTTARQKIEQYLIHNPTGKINTGELSRLFEVSRERVRQILDVLGETRHNRVPKKQNYCETCEKPISSRANFCRSHSKILERIKGQQYQCRVCQEYKQLEEFAKSNMNYSGYETRCLSCRATWQREYYRTEKGRVNHSRITSELAKRHPERQRAYYQVYKAKSEGIINKEYCFNCGDTNTQAIHSDYTKPLDVTWACPTCRHLVPDANTYIANPLEEGFRTFIQSHIGSTNSLGKWIRILKAHYNTNELNTQILVNSIKEYKQINGLGRQYKVLASQYADELLIELYPQNQS